MDRTRRWPRLGGLLATLLLVNPLASAYDLDVNSTDSIKKISKQMAGDMLSFYHGDEPGNTPGLLPDPYYWWEAGAMMGALIDYWYYTKDDSYVELTKQALLFQVGDNDDYMPRNQTRTEGNDDQGFWGLAVMSAAEYNFPNPDDDQPQWLGLAQAVFNTQAARWDPDHCNGGLRWQIFQWNNGYDYKNSISQACFFALGARLALFTGNDSYADWAEKTWDWTKGVGLIAENYNVYDGGSIGENCTDIVPYQFSYNAGGFILGAAAMYNYTESQVWKDRLDSLLDAAKVFFTGPDKNIMEEVACERVNRCNLDQQSFKAYLSRWMAAITKWAPDTYDFVMPYLEASAVAAAKQCVGGDNGRMCGMKWNQDKYDGTTGVGQQMAAMEVTLACMVADRAAPLTSDSGGTSQGNPGAGGDDIGRTEPPGPTYSTISAGDRAGAAILTVAILGSLIAGVIWIMLDETSDKSPATQFNSATAAIAAFAVGGGAAAALRRKGDHKDYKEKGRAVANDSDSSSRTSGENQVTVPTPIAVTQVRNENPRHTRRLSNMPLGWPHNPSVRGSTLILPDGSRPWLVRDSASGSLRPQSMRHSPAESVLDSGSDLPRPHSMRPSPSASVMESVDEAPRPQSVRGSPLGSEVNSDSDIQRPRSMHTASSSSMETASEDPRPRSMHH